VTRELPACYGVAEDPGRRSRGLRQGTCLDEQRRRGHRQDRVLGHGDYILDPRRTWLHPRRAVVKAEVVVHPSRELRDNSRIVITNLGHGPESLYRAIYCARGDSKNRAEIVAS
jgi:hypothetical protein